MRQYYDNPKLSDYESVTDFLTALTNLVHLVNKELSGVAGYIEDWTIAMHTIHSFPPCMHTLQTILIKATPPSNDMTWDLDDLKKEIKADESHAQATGENLGMKINVVHNPKALAAEQGRMHGRRRDPNDPSWVAQQMCWNCSQMGRLHHKCLAPRTEKSTHQEKRTGESDAANAALIELEVYARVFIAKASDEIALATEIRGELPKQWPSTLVAPITSLPINPILSPTNHMRHQAVSALEMIKASHPWGKEWSPLLALLDGNPSPALSRMCSMFRT